MILRLRASEAEEVCDRVALIDRGEILATQTRRTLGTLITKYDRIDYKGGDSDLEARILALPGVESVAELAAGRQVEEQIEVCDCSGRNRWSPFPAAGIRSTKSA